MDVAVLEPSENWDDDFEFQESRHGSTNNSGRSRKGLTDRNNSGAVVEERMLRTGHAGVGDVRKLSVASSVVTEDWDLPEDLPVASTSTSGRPTTVHATLSISTHLSSTSGPRLTATENWDDDFDDSRNSPAKKNFGRNQKTIHDDGDEPEESWDEEDDEEENEFGFNTGGKEEEDRTVTARTRRGAAAALARMAGPLPPLPLPSSTSSMAFLRDPPPSSSSSHHPQPFPSPGFMGYTRPHSPTSTASVFSVPNTVSAYSYSSTTHLNSRGHGQGHRPSSAFALLPPSPPIHKERERRRLRKKSRPRPQGTFELASIGSAGEEAVKSRYSFSGDEREKAATGGPGMIGSAYRHMRSEVSVESVDEREEEAVAGVEPVGACGLSLVNAVLPVSLPPTTSIPGTPTKGAGMLSRLGSVKKWGVAVRNRRRGSTTPSEVAAHEDLNQELQRTPRPRSSMSSINADSSTHSHIYTRYIPRHPNRHSTTGAPVVSTTSHGVPGTSSTNGNANSSSSNSWFFRASSTGSPSRARGYTYTSTSSAAAGTAGELQRGLSVRTTGSARSGYESAEGRKSRRGSRSSSRSKAAGQRQPPPPQPAFLSGREGGGTGRGGDGGDDDAFGPQPGSGGGTGSQSNNKLIKRKSLGFVKLGMGSSRGGHDGVGGMTNGTPGGRYQGLGLGRVEKEKDRKASEETGPTEDTRTRRKSFSKFLKERRSVSREAEGRRTKERDREKENSAPSSPFVVIDTPSPAPPAVDAKASGSRGFMGSVRRISLVGVGKHKRSKSGAPVAGVGGGTGQPPVSPSPGSRFFGRRGSVDEKGKEREAEKKKDIPPLPYALPPLPGTVVASMSQISLGLPSAASSSSHVNLPSTLAVPKSRSVRGKRIVSGSSQTSSVMPPSTASSLSRASVVAGGAAERRTSGSLRRGLGEDRVGSGRPSLDFDLSMMQANMKAMSEENQKQEKEQGADDDDDDEIIDDMKTPSKPKAATILKPPQIPLLPSLLPPIELQPPSPPNTVTPSSGLLPHSSNNDPVKPSRSLASAFGTNTGNSTDALSPATSTSSIFFTPTSSPNKHASSHKASSKLSPGGKSPASQQSASLGRSTGAPGIASTAEQVVTGTPRRNSLGDLKIPARISQAQVGLRRDLGMVREFANNVEQIKDLQQTYHSLMSEVKTILDDYAHKHAQQAYLAAASSSPIDGQPRSASPGFLSNLTGKGRIRVRSNTNPGSTPPLISSQRPSMDETSEFNQQLYPLPYKEMASRFYTINSKYKLSWECAELLIELGGGGSGGDSGKVDAGVGISSPSSTSASIPAVRPAIIQTPTKGRERAVTLTGDEEKPAGLLSFGTSTKLDAQHASALSQLTSSHPHASSSSWRASTGRHDLSQRQISLLREMLNNSQAIVSSSSAVLDDAYAGGEGDDSQQSIPEDTIPRQRIPLAVQSLQAVHMTATSGIGVNPNANLFVNRDWRWGDARNSTITLPSEDEVALGFGDGGHRGSSMKGKEKRKSGKLGMAGFRDILRALRRGQGHVDVSGGAAGVGIGGVFAQSTTSLSTESSVGSRSHSRHGHRSLHPRLPLPPPPPAPAQQTNTFQTHGRRRAKTSIGPDESVRSMKTPQATINGVRSVSPFGPTSSFGHATGGGGGKSPRRPSLASIFRIGGSKSSRPASIFADQVPTAPVVDMVNADGFAPPAPASATTESSTAASTDMEADAENSSAGHGHEFVRPGTAGEETSSTGEEEDWDRMDSCSDLDVAAAAKLLGVDGAATIRGPIHGGDGGNKLQKARKGKGKSPYLQRDTYDPPHRPDGASSNDPPGMKSLPASPDYPTSTHHSIISKRSFNNSQASLSRPHHPHIGSPLSPSYVPPSRTTKLSNVDEHPLATSPSTSLAKPSSPFSPTGSTSLRSTTSPAQLPLSTSMPAPWTEPRLAMTPENIKPLLENAREVHAKLGECIAEILTLLGRNITSMSATPPAIISAAPMAATIVSG